MIVCHCENVSHREVDAAIAAGARSVSDIARACGAGTCCGGCVGTLKQRLLAARAELGATAPEGVSVVPRHARQA